MEDIYTMYFVIVPLIISTITACAAQKNLYPFYYEYKRKTCFSN